MPKVHLAFAAAAVIATGSAYADQVRPMEDVMMISADSAMHLFADPGYTNDRTMEPVTIIAAKDAANLLGDPMDLTVGELNNMPATAAGEQIMMIDADAAMALLGDPDL